MPRTNYGVPREAVELAKDLRKEFGGYMTAAAVGRWLGASPKVYTKWLSDIPGYLIGERKKYDVRDVARKLVESKED